MRSGISSFSLRLKRDGLPVTALAVLLLNMAPLERVVETDGGYDRLYGFPLGWAPNAYYSSMALDVFLLELAFDFTTCFAIAFGIVQLLRRICGWKHPPETATKTGSIMILVLLISWMVITHWDGHIYLHNNLPFETLSVRLHTGP